MFIDLDGEIPWPLQALYKGFGRSHLNNWHEVRQKAGGGTRLHQGVDMNHTGGGNTDYGAPILSTHDGYVSKIVTNDNNAGGRRIVITSKDGTVSTSYMHLSDVENYNVGDAVFEGQVLGQMGGSGFGNDNQYSSHLHYELRVNGDNINPIGSNGEPMDPQSLLQTNEVFARPSQQTQTNSSIIKPQKQESIIRQMWNRVKEAWKGNWTPESNN
jgi:murein DD-endopeptidase MepM/ murein hydrolase activator NlpD